MPKKTTPKERREYIEQQREALANSPLRGRVFGDVSFIDREGNIVRPNKKDYEADLKRRGGYPIRASHVPLPPNAERYRHGRKAERGVEYQAPQEAERYSSPRARRYHAVITIAGVLGGLFFLSPNMTGNAIANISQNSSNILGAVLLVVGLVGAFFWVKRK